MNIKKDAVERFSKWAVNNLKNKPLEEDIDNWIAGAEAMLERDGYYNFEFSEYDTKCGYPLLFFFSLNDAEGLPRYLAEKLKEKTK